MTIPFCCVTNICIARLYEQGADINRIGQYVRKWYKWLFSGLAHFLKKIYANKRDSAFVSSVPP
jgi:hypothetical protein